jgi:cytochrome c oxidase subunit II
MTRLNLPTSIAIILAGVVSLLAGSPAIGAGGKALAPQDKAREIQLTAKKYEFNPSVIEVKQGEHIKLIITATDHDHGFECGGLHINQLLKKGDPTTIEFTADKAGTFSFRCSHFCGMGHLKMKGKIVAAPASK